MILNKMLIFFNKSTFYILKLFILLGLVLMHVIIYFFINFYMVKHFPNFYVTLFRMVEYGVVDLWPVLKNPQECMQKFTGDPASDFVPFVFEPLLMFVSVGLMLDYIMSWPMFVIHYWGLICYNVLSPFFSWIPNWSIEMFNFPYSYYMIIYATIYFVLTVYMFFFQKNLSMVSKSLVKYMALWLFAMIAMLIWFMFFTYYHSIVWFFMKTVLYFSGVSLLIVKMTKSEMQ